jgi:hypothetical protein
MAQYTFHLDGPPVAHIKSTEGSTWSDYKKGHVVHRIQLSNQHEDRPSITGKLHIDFLFVFPEKCLKPPRQDIGKKYARLCSLVAYVRYIEEVSKELLFNPLNVVSLKASMEYGAEPKSTFIITVK